MPFFRLWARNATILWIIHISLGIITTILTIIITSLASISSVQSYISILAVIAAISAALLTSLDIGTKSNNTRNAWRKLNTAMMKYNQGVFTSKEQVINAYEEGEALISGINFTLSPPSSPKA
jgi:flagellar motor component MotA